MKDQRIVAGARVEWCKAHGYNQPGSIISVFENEFFVQWDEDEPFEHKSYDERDLSENGGNITFIWEYCKDPKCEHWNGPIPADTHMHCANGGGVLFENTSSGTFSAGKIDKAVDIGDDVMCVTTTPLEKSGPDD